MTMAHVYAYVCLQSVIETKHTQFALSFGVTLIKRRTVTLQLLPDELDMLNPQEIIAELSMTTNHWLQ